MLESFEDTAGSRLDFHCIKVHRGSDALPVHDRASMEQTYQIPFDGHSTASVPAILANYVVDEIFE